MSRTPSGTTVIEDELDPELAAFVARVPPPADPSTLTLRELREGARRLTGLAGDPEDCAVRDDTVAGRPARWYGSGEGTLLWIHGGGFVRGDLDTHDVLCRALAHRSGATVLALDHRLAPEHPFPAAIDDALGAVDAIRGPLVVAGDSSGGSVAAVVARERRDRLAGQVLACPALDATLSGESARRHAHSPLLTTAATRWSWQQYAGPLPLDDPRLSPLAAPSVERLPPAYVLVSGHDPLRDDGLRYAQRLRDADVPVVLDHRPGATHSLLLLTGISGLARDAVDAVGAWVATRLGG